MRNQPVPPHRRARNENHDVRIARALAHAPLDLGHEFKIALQNRLAVVLRDLTMLVHAVEAILPKGQDRMARSMFSDLNRDSAFDDRLAHLEAGIATQRLYLAAASLGLAAVTSQDFYDEECRIFLGLAKTGWEVLSLVAVGRPMNPAAAQREQKAKALGQVGMWDG